MSELEGLKLLRRIEEGVAGKTGEAFFRQIVRDLAAALNAHSAFTSRLLPERRAAMLAFWVSDHFERCLEYSLAGTPCEFVYRGEITSFARDVGQRFPVDREWFESLGVCSYLGIPVRGETGEVCGHLAVMDTRERDWREADVDILRLFSLRTAAELERRRHLQELEEANAALQRANEQLRDEVARRLEIERALEASKLVAEQASHAKSAFLAQMSHELRTPLNGLLGYAQLLERDTAHEPRQLESIGAMRRCGEHLLTLINELLDLARIESNRAVLEPCDFDLAELLSGVTEMMCLRAREAGIDFVSEKATDLPSVIHADPRRLRQILLNLLGNALKFTVAGHVALRTHVAERSGAAVRLHFEIEDTGDGIAEQELERIFEPFHQVANSRGQEQGTGLGLPISRGLVQAMGGSLTVRSQIGVGSTFLVELDVEVSLARPRQPVAIRQRIVGYAGATRRVLIADDEDHNRRVLQQWLQPLGFKIHEAADGNEAVELASSLRPDALLLDLVMPGLDGFAVARSLRARAEFATLPIIALSASAFEHTREQCLAAGCNDFLPKPLELGALQETMRRHLGLTWLMEPGQEHPPVSAGAFASLPADVQLPSELAGRMLDHAMCGDVVALGAAIDELARLEPALGPIATRLRGLAAQFDMRAIRMLLRSVGAPSMEQRH